MAFPPLADLVFAYGRITLTVYVAQRGRDFYLILGCADPLGLTATSRTLKHAQLIYAATPDLTFELLRTGHADAFASIRAVLLAYAPKLPGSRVLEDHYGANLLGMVVPKGQAGRLAYISEFIEQAKASGLVQQAITRAGLPEHQVASAKTN